MNWDKYYLGICKAVAANCKCHSRQIGAILVKDKSIISTGFNGPPRGIKHCNPCPRKAQGFLSGEGLHLCPAVHTEVNCIAQAARNGVNTSDSTIYMTCGIPCKACLGVIINAGVKVIVCTSLDYYDELSKSIVSQAEILIRLYDV